MSDEADEIVGSLGRELVSNGKRIRLHAAQLAVDELGCRPAGPLLSHL